jgi:hypothetical protein
MTLVFILGVFGLLLGIQLTVWKLWRESVWLRAVLVPWLNSISQAVNPDRK